MPAVAAPRFPRACRRRGNNSLVESSVSGRNLQRQTPMAASVNAVNRKGRARSVRVVAPQQRWQQEKHGGRHAGRSQAREMAASPLLGLRAREGRRAKPTLRRKRVATMRSVNGWIRETDPTSHRRHLSLNRRIAALRQKGNRRRKESGPFAVSRGANQHEKHLGDGIATFLTELETDGAARVAEIISSRGNGITNSCPDNTDRQRRGRNEQGGKNGRYPQRSEGEHAMSGITQRERPRRLLSGTVRGTCSNLNGRRRPLESGVANAHGGRSEVAQFGSGRTTSVGGANRWKEQHRDERNGTPAVAAGNGAPERGREGIVKRHPGRPTQTDVSVSVDEGSVVTTSANAWVATA